MGEKRGNTGKLKYDFNTAWAAEVQMDDKWYRVTEKDFRSFNGPRRLTCPTGVELGNPFIPNKTFMYEGAYYFFDTNLEYDPSQHPQGQIIHDPNKERIEAKRTTVAKI